MEDRLNDNKRSFASRVRALLQRVDFLQAYLRHEIGIADAFKIRIALSSYILRM